MARRWNLEEEKEKRDELTKLYVEENKTIGEVARCLGLAEGTVYDRLLRLGIPSQPWLKPKSCNRHSHINIPDYSCELAEFIGILLGDGCITPTQVTVTLGTKEDGYVKHVSNLMRNLFNADPRTLTSKNGKTVYFGSTLIVRWLLRMGLARNKVLAQVDIPEWVKTRTEYKIACLRGLIDTDGSVYKLRWGFQISFTNYAKPLLHSAREVLIQLGFHPSRVTRNAFYLTRKEDLDKFNREVGFRNPKHLERFRRFSQS